MNTDLLKHFSVGRVDTIQVLYTEEKLRQRNLARTNGKM